MIDKHKTKQANLKRKLRDLDRRFTLLDRSIRARCGRWPKSYEATVRDRWDADAKRKEVRRELKARPI